MSKQLIRSPRPNRSVEKTDLKFSTGPQYYKTTHQKSFPQFSTSFPQAQQTKPKQSHINLYTSRHLTGLIYEFSTGP